MFMAITRAVSESLGRCELTHLERLPIDVARAGAQHAAYEEALRGLGAQVVRARVEPEMPDAVFVEDTAMVVDEGAVMLRPGAESRRGETAGVAEVLGKYRKLVWMVEEGTVDGGDVLRVGKKVYVGRTTRTNAAGIERLREVLGRWGYEVVGVEVRGCLHLKSAATQVGAGLLLINPTWVAKASFEGMEFVEVDAGEAYGANVLWVGGGVIYPEHFPRTRARLEKRGIHVIPVPCDELAKAEGAVTCCSILFEA